MRNPLKFTEERNKRIKTEICEIFDLEWHIVTSKSRRKKIMEARRLYCALLRNIFMLPLETIGKLTNTHHASVLHTIKQHNDYSEIYKGYDKNYENIKESLIDKSSLTYFLDELSYLERKKNKIQQQIDNLILIQNQN
jgi:chromosomal replication initiation ATPase DnaA